MTTLTDRPRTAVVVIDVQNRVVSGAYRRDEVLANIATVVDKAREQHVPVVWVRHHSEEMPTGSEGWQIVPDLVPASGEPVVDKAYGDAFEDTTMELVLAGLAVGRLVVTGAQTDACVRSTLHGALARGYDATLVSDAHTTEDLSSYGAPTPDLVVAHTNLYWAYQTAPGRTAGTVTTAEVDFHPPA